MLLRIGSLVFIVPVIVLVAVYSIDMSAISDCLVREQGYDPDTGQCIDTDQSPPTFYARHTIIINLSLLLSILGAMAMTWGMILKGPSSRAEER